MFDTLTLLSYTHLWSEEGDATIWMAGPLRLPPVSWLDFRGNDGRT
jgi:hypothetical protein